MWGSGLLRPSRMFKGYRSKEAFNRDRRKLWDAGWAVEDIERVGPMNREIIGRGLTVNLLAVALFAVFTKAFCEYVATYVRVAPPERTAGPAATGGRRPRARIFKRK